MSYPGAPLELKLASAAAWMDELKSGQLLTRLFSERGPQAAAICLLVLLALDSALIVTRAFDKPAAVPANAGPSPMMRAPVNPNLQLSVIVNAHLFGSAGVTSNGYAADSGWRDR
jgi:hypothetical protein